MSRAATGVAVVAGVLLAVLAAGRDVAAATPRSGATSPRILLLFDEDQSLPGLAVLDQSLRATLTAGLDHVEFYSESLSLSQFTDERREDIVSKYFRQKYSARQPDLIVAIMGPSLHFLLRHGDAVFPGVPIVFCGADPADIETVTLPKTVTGFQPFEGRVAIEYLTDLAMTDLLARAKGLPQNSLVLYLSLFRDAAGNAFVPHNVAAALADSELVKEAIVESPLSA
jgi:hypothetical protein